MFLFCIFLPVLTPFFSLFPFFPFGWDRDGNWWSPVLDVWNGRIFLFPFSFFFFLIQWQYCFIQVLFSGFIPPCSSCVWRCLNIGGLVLASRNIWKERSTSRQEGTEEKTLVKFGIFMGCYIISWGIRERSTVKSQEISSGSSFTMLISLPHHIITSVSSPGHPS